MNRTRSYHFEDDNAHAHTRPTEATYGFRLCTDKRKKERKKGIATAAIVVWIFPSSTQEKQGWLRYLSLSTSKSIFWTNKFRTGKPF